MSAVPGNFLNFGSWDTISAELPDTQLSTGIPSNVVDVPKTDGVTFSGVLNGISSTADSLINAFGKIYSINSAVENAKFQQTVKAAELEVNKARTLGTLDVQRASIDANVSIAKAQAARATNDALAQVNSGSAGFLNKGAKISPMLIILGLAGIGAVLYLRKGK